MRMQIIRTIRLAGAIFIVASLMAAFYLGSILVNDYMSTVSGIVDLKVSYRILSASLYNQNSSNLYFEMIVALNPGLKLNNTRLMIGGYVFNCWMNNTNSYLCYVNISSEGVSGSTRIIFSGRHVGIISYSIEKNLTCINNILNEVTPSVSNIYCISTNNHTKYLLIEISSKYYYTGSFKIKFIYTNLTLTKEFNITIQPNTTSVLKIKSVCTGELIKIILYYPFNYTKTYAVVKNEESI